jgi:hypothetical protein
VSTEIDEATILLRILKLLLFPEANFRWKFTAICTCYNSSAVFVDFMALRVQHGNELVVRIVNRPYPCVLRLLHRVFDAWTVSFGIIGTIGDCTLLFVLALHLNGVDLLVRDLEKVVTGLLDDRRVVG